MNHKLLTLLILFSPLSYAENIEIDIPSTITPDGINLQKYNELRLQHKRNVAEKTIDYRLVGAKAAAAEKAKRDATQAKSNETARAEADAKVAAQKANEGAAMKKAEAKKMRGSFQRILQAKKQVHV